MQQPMTLSQMLMAFDQATAEFQAGRMPAPQYSAALAALRGLDEQGRWWCCAADGSFLMYNGAQWVPGSPRQAAPPPPAAPPWQPPPSPAREMVQNFRPFGDNVSQDDPVMRSNVMQKWLRFAVSPVLAMVPGIACGGLWFIYSLLAVGRETIVGVDFITPLAIIGLPLLMYVFRSKLDRLLMPIQPIRMAFPPAFRWGAAIGLPMILGLGCSTITGSGYGALNITAIIGILASFVLIHNPAVQR